MGTCRHAREQSGGVKRKNLGSEKRETAWDLFPKKVERKKDGTRITTGRNKKREELGFYFLKDRVHHQHIQAGEKRQTFFFIIIEVKL